MTQRFGPYQVGETVGHGTFGKVKVAVHESTRTKVALKVIPRKLMGQDARSRLKIIREIQILKLLQHPNIVRLYDVVQTKHDIVFVLEYVSGGELFDYICQNTRVAEDAARHLFQQIVAAVAYIHRHRVAHRDLKPENIMIVRGTNTIKIGDFGLSSISHDGCFLETSCGTPNYASPEIVSGKLYAGPETDVWSCGVVLYTMLVGALPFDEQNVTTLFKMIQTANYTIPSDISDEAKDLLRRILVVNPLERATIEQVMQHPWMRPEFPPYLLSLHFDAILDAEQFGKTVSSSDNALDGSIIDAVAARFGISPQETASIVAMQEDSKLLLFNPDARQDSGKRKRYPGEKFFESYANAVDAKVWPAPLVIPPAEQVLRSVEHDMYVSYRILLQRKHDQLPLEHVRHRGAWSEVAGSHVLSQSAGQGYGSLNANSLQQISFGAASLPRSIQPLHQQDATTSLTGHKGGADRTFFGSLPASVQLDQQGEGSVDPYIEDYNGIAEAFLPLYGIHSKHTLLGMLLGVVEHPIAARLPQPVTRASCATSGKTGGGNSLTIPLLKPITEAVAVSTTLPRRAGERLLRPAFKKGEDERSRQANGPLNSTDNSFPLRPPITPDAFQCGVTTRFGNNFVRNGVMFSPSEPLVTLRQVYSAMKEEGLLWKTIHPYYFAAVVHPSVKLQVRIYKITLEVQLVDVKVSSQSGMRAYEVASRLLDRLRTKAISHAKVRQERTAVMGDCKQKY